MFLVSWQNDDPCGAFGSGRSDGLDCVVCDNVVCQYHPFNYVESEDCL